MGNSLQIKIKAKVYDMIKVVSDNQSINTYEKMELVEDLVANCNFMVGIAETIEINEPYVKVVEKTEEQSKTVKEVL